MTKAWITIVAVSGAGCRSGPDLTVLIAQPTDGTIVTGEVVLDAIVEPATVLGVEISINDRRLAALMQPPWRWQWDSRRQPDGAATLRVTASTPDAVATATVGVIIDNEAPVVQIVSPTPGASFEPNGGPIALRADVVDPSGVAEVRFAVDGEPVAALDAPPWRTLVDPTGWHRDASNAPAHRLEVTALSRGGLQHSVERTFEIAPRLRWRLELGAPITGIASRPNGAVVATVDGRLTAVDRHGTIQWTAVTAGGIFAAAVVDDAGDIFVGDDTGTVYAFDSGGDLRWSAQPAALGGTIAVAPVATRSGLLVPFYDGRVFRFAYAGGRVGSAASTATLSRGIIAAPMISDGLRHALAVTTAGELLGFGLLSISDKGARHFGADRDWSWDGVAPVPAFNGERQLFVADGAELHRMGLQSFEAEPGTPSPRVAGAEPLWTASLPAAAASLLPVGDDIVVLDADGALHRFDGVGRAVWSTEAWGRVGPTPAVDRDVIIVAGGRGEVIAIAAPTGRALWGYELSGEVVAEAVISAGIAYVGDCGDAAVACALDGTVATGALYALTAGAP